MQSSLQKFGTIAFDREYMKHMIKYGQSIDGIEDRHTIDVGFWLQFVPLVYRDKVIPLVQEVGRDFICEKATEELRLRFVLVLHQKIWNVIKPTTLSKELAREGICERE